MLDNSVKAAIQGAYSQFLSSKELKPRYGQKLMIAEIARTLGNIRLDEENHNIAEKNIAVIEAGTGTGKTVAYLLSVLPLAFSLEKRVVLSTATVALQEQVSIKDIPDILQHSGLKFNYVLAKGRGRYLCLSKLERLLADSGSSVPVMYEDEVIALSPDDLSLYRKMLKRTVDGEWDGDKDSWNEDLSPDTWSRVTTDHRQCAGRKCSNIRDCAFFNARNALEDADLIVANHDLVLADLALGGGAILPAPEDTIYIFDEGHHLPEKALHHFAAHTRYRGSIRWLGQSEGQWPTHLKTVADLSYFSQLSQPLEARLKDARSVLEDELPLIRELCEEIDPSAFSPKLQFSLGEVDDRLEALAQKASRRFAELTELLEKLYKEMDTVVSEEGGMAVPAKDAEAMLSLLGGWLSRAEANLALWQSYRDTRFDEKQPFARWITLILSGETPDYELVSSPVLASGILRNGLWSRCCGAVLTSATMRALNSFDRFKIKAGLSDDASFEAVPSPFDFHNNATLSVPKAAVEANRAFEHTESLIRLLPEIIDIEASTLVLFSSHAQMNQVLESMPVALSDIVLCQGRESKQYIVEQHKARVDKKLGSIIWGLASFAEGVDLPGNYCSHVIIAKLPFSVPDEPLEAAYSEWVEARGGNAFMEVTVPDASTRLIQACGRLLRTETDTGKISILDKRLVSKRYGSAIIKSLPPFKVDY